MINLINAIKAICLEHNIRPKYTISIEKVGGFNFMYIYLSPDCFIGFYPNMKSSIKGREESIKTTLIERNLKTETLNQFQFDISSLLAMQYKFIRDTEENDWHYLIDTDNTIKTFSRYHLDLESFSNFAFGGDSI